MNRKGVRYRCVPCYHPLRCKVSIRQSTYSAIVHGCHGSEPFLTCCVPDLESYFTIVNNSIRYEDGERKGSVKERRTAALRVVRQQMCGANCFSIQTNVPKTYNFLVMKDAPMVDVQLAENVFWTYRTTSEVFPTPIQKERFTNRVQR